MVNVAMQLFPEASENIDAVVDFILEDVPDMIVGNTAEVTEEIATNHERIEHMYNFFRVSDYRTLNVLFPLDTLQTILGSNPDAVRLVEAFVLKLNEDEYGKLMSDLDGFAGSLDRGELDEIVKFAREVHARDASRPATPDSYASSESPPSPAPSRRPWSAESKASYTSQSFTTPVEIDTTNDNLAEEPDPAWFTDYLSGDVEDWECVEKVLFIYSQLSQADKDKVVQQNYFSDPGLTSQVYFSVYMNFWRDNEALDADKRKRLKFGKCLHVDKYGTKHASWFMRFRKKTRGPYGMKFDDIIRNYRNLDAESKRVVEQNDPVKAAELLGYENPDNVFNPAWFVPAKARDSELLSIFNEVYEILDPVIRKKLHSPGCNKTASLDFWKTELNKDRWKTYFQSNKHTRLKRLRDGELEELAAEEDEASKPSATDDPPPAEAGVSEQEATPAEPHPANRPAPDQPLAIPEHKQPPSPGPQRRIG